MKNANKLEFVSKKPTKKGSKAQARAKADRKANKYNSLRMYIGK